MSYSGFVKSISVTALHNRCSVVVSYLPGQASYELLSILEVALPTTNNNGFTDNPFIIIPTAIDLPLYTD